VPLTKVLKLLLFPPKVIELLSQGKKYYDSLFGDAELGM
jgi:hypothetical protein